MRTDEELIAAMAAGEKAALEVLYRRHAPWLAGRLSHATSSRDLAEEALQDCFVAVWRRAGSFRGEGDVGAWLWAIARRRLASLARKRVDVPAIPADESTSELADDEALANIDADRVRAAVTRLPSDQRVVVECVVFDGERLVDVASRLGVPIGTLKSRLHRARRQIRAEMDA